jgi:GT2 family glycosyltransferase/SAM-dependent methyltransferase
MHPSALEFGSIFFETYCKDRVDIVIVDVGSQDVNGSLRDVSPNNAKYIGVDFVSGKNVDIILNDPYKLPFENGSVDVVVCSSVFEHSQFFWVLFLEIMRILKPDGLFYLNVPSNGYIHRYPVDCWRFYPDSALALVAWAVRNGFHPALLESFVGEKKSLSIEHDAWNDFVAIFVKDRKYQDVHKLRVVSSLPEYSNAYCDNGFIDPKPSLFTDDFLIISDQSDEIANLNQVVREREVEIANLNQVVREREVEIANLNQVVEVQVAEIRSFVNSNSWKLTLPFRFGGRLIRRFRYFVMSGLLAFLNNCGLKKIFNKITQYNRTEAFDFSKNNITNENYSEWIARSEMFDDVSEAVKKIENFPSKPLISIIFIVTNPKFEWLTESIESVLNQTYSNWELCIFNESSNDQLILDALNRYANQDKRINVIFGSERTSTSSAFNSALSSTKGNWVAILNNEDTLSPHALYYVVEGINQNSGIRLIYSDEDNIDKFGRRFNPYFKTDWNLDLFYSQNMFSNLGVFRTDILVEVNGFRGGYEGSQVYELVLRCIELLQANQIHHLPRVLYHNRIDFEAEAYLTKFEPCGNANGVIALNEHFHRINTNARAELVDNGYRVRYALPSKLPLVSLIIPSKNGLKLIRNCVDSILQKTSYQNYEIIIIDNGSDEQAVFDLYERFQLDSRVRVIHDKRPFNYSQLNNTAVNSARGEVIGLLNNDLVVISPDWLSEMVSFAMQERIGAVGAKLLYPNDTLQHGGVVLGIGEFAGHSHRGFPKNHLGYKGRMSLISGFSAVTGACLIVRKELYEKLGGLNEDKLAIACNDVDFCLRLRELGLANVWTPYAELYHHESASRGYEDTPSKKARFKEELAYMKQRWGIHLRKDPAYNPNLTSENENFGISTRAYS